MKIMKCFVLAALFTFLSCTHKEVVFYDTDSSVPITSTIVNMVIAKEKPIRLSYVDDSGDLQTNIRGYLTKLTDSSYQFERRKFGEPPSNNRITLGMSQIRKVTVIDNDAPQVRDFVTMGTVIALAIVVIVLTFTFPMEPMSFN